MQMDAPIRRRANIRAASAASLGLLLLLVAGPAQATRPMARSAPSNLAHLRRLLTKGAASPNAVCDKYTVQGGDSLWAIADRAGTTVDRVTQLTNFSAGECKAIADPSQLQPGDCVCLPTCNSYTIQSGDSLYNIATAHGSTVDAVVANNNMRGDCPAISDPSNIQPGSCLCLPGEAPECDKYAFHAGDSLYDVAATAGSSVDEVTALTNASAGQCPTISDPTQIQIGQCVCLPRCNYYTIQAGDSLSNIASAHSTTAQAILDATNIRPDCPAVSDPNQILPGNCLCLPHAGPTPTPTPTPPGPTPPAPTPSSGRRIVGYFQTWSDPFTSTPADSQLAKIAPYVNTVVLSFMKPDATYSSGSWAGTGINFSSDFATIKASIALLKQKNPGTQVLIAVGGATYTNWAGLNASAVGQLVTDLGLDGVDVDYEPSAPQCQSTGTSVSCATDAEFIRTVQAIRAAVPRPKVVSLAGFSVGAFGEGPYAQAQPASDKTGLCVNMLKSGAGNDLDLINIMAYDAGNAYDPKQALDAFMSYFPGDVALGVEVANEAWGGHVTSISEVDALAAHVVDKKASGMMIWSLQKPADAGPTAEQIAQEMCNKLGMASCSSPLFA